MYKGVTAGDYISKEFGEEFLQNIWSDKNDKSAYEYAKCSNKEVWWKCPDGRHDDYLRSCDHSYRYNYSCVHCTKSRAYRQDSYFIGKTFGELYVNSVNEEQSILEHQIMLNCTCSCGNKLIVRGQYLKNGSVKTCGNRSIHRLGENNSNWRGGSTTEYEKQRKSNSYDIWRDSVYAKDWYTCQCCGSTMNKKHAHHLLNFSNNEELRFDVLNGITLCEKCHYPTFEGSFHNIYGTQNNTPEQLEEFINNKRKELGINIHFSIEEYKNGINILKPKKKGAI